jgi:hypothetical protein
MVHRIRERGPLFPMNDRIRQVIGLTEIRSLAMALPEVDEGPLVRAAHRIAGFKVAGKSFLGVEVGGRSITVSLSEKEARTIAAENPKAYEEIWRNGETFKGLRVDLSTISIDRVRDLIERSWRYCKANHSAIR